MAEASTSRRPGAARRSPSATPRASASARAASGASRPSTAWFRTSATAARVLTGRPAFTGFAVASLAIGIGAGAAVFSLADTVLFRTMAVARSRIRSCSCGGRPARCFPFISLNGNGDQNDSGLSSTSFSYVAYQSFRRTRPDTRRHRLRRSVRSTPRSTAARSWQRRTSCPTTTSTCWAWPPPSGARLARSTTTPTPLRRR